MRIPILKAALLPALLLTMSACFKLGRDTPVLQQYVLGGAPPAAVAGAANLSGVSVGLRRLDLAPYLAIPAVVVRRGPHQVIVSQYHRWAEEPGDGINRAVARYLARAAPVRGVDVAPWPMGSKYDYMVQLHITRFEGVTLDDSLATGGEVLMQAVWEILRHQDGRVLARGATDFRQPDWRVGDYGALVTQLDRGLGNVARDVAACLGTVAGAQQPVAATSATQPPPAAISCGAGAE